MPKKTITITVWACNKCGHEWRPRRKTKPLICPKCKSAGWDRPKK